jgi:predicted ATPase
MLVATPLPSPAETAPIAERMTQRVKESGLRPHKFMRLLKKFLKQFLKGLGAQGAGDAEKVKRGESILEKFFDRVGKLPAETEIRVNQVAFEQASVKSFFEVKAEKTVQPAVQETV